MSMNNAVLSGWKYLIISVVLLTAAGAVLPSAAEEPAVRRYGLFVGANDGGRDRVQLRYAGSDAQAVAEVLQRAGGLSREHTLLLYDPAPAEIAAGLRTIDERIKAGGGSKGREEFIFYYSGHSDQDGLLLGGERYSYRRLRDELKAVEADVHIAILDSCSSGAFTRLKGGMRRSPFLFDESTEAEGHAFLTSSSASEAAQESDEIGGSFFTHYLLSALSGAGDASRDQRVSLNEAYSFASEETLARTEHSAGGPQHPSYDFNLAGTGDLVLTDLREGVEQITFAEGLAGRLSVRDFRGRPVLEMRKEADSPVTITLPPGRYTVTLDDGRDLYRAEITLFAGGKVAVGSELFQRTYRSPAVSRGGAAAEPEEQVYDGVDFNFINVRDGGIDGVQVAVIGNVLAGNMDGVQVASVFNISEGTMEGVQISGVFNITEGAVKGPQISGVFNMVEGSVQGPQIAGVFNMAEGAVHGPQIAGVFNMAEGERSEGVQLAGVFNMAGDMDGMQCGVVNIGRKVTGMQAGVVNVSEELNGVPLGLINIAGNGLHSLSGWYDDGRMLNLGFQLGTFYYTFFTAGINPEDPDQAFSGGIGMGLELPLGGFYIDTDVYAESYSEGAGSFDANVARVFSNEKRIYPAVRLSLGKYLGGGKSAVFGGVDMAVCVRGYSPYVEGAMSGVPWSLDYSGEGDMLDIYPRWFFGLRL
jgi:hypothetical protein